MKKQISLLLATSLLSIASASAAVNLYKPTSTIGSGAFDDSTSGGYSETLSVGPLVGIWAPMDYPGFFSYSSVSPHVDSASLSMGLTQAPAGGLTSMPFFSATGSLSQVASTLGTVSNLGFQFSSQFEGIMAGADPLLAMTFLGINVSGTVGSVPGEYVSFNMQQTYIDSVSFLNIGTLAWTYSNSIPSATFSTTIYPTWTWTPSGSPVLTNNLIDIQGFINVQADPSSISFAPAEVPEPGAFALIVLGAGVWASVRRKASRTV